MAPSNEAAECVCLADVEPTKVDWLWPGRIPYGKVSIIEGRPEAGKSTLTLEIAACVTTGRTLPGGTPLEPMNVLLVGVEDGLEDTVAPRFISAGGNRSRVFAPPAGLLLSFPSEIATLRAYVERNAVRLVVIDPITAFLDDATNTHNDHKVRRALAPLAQLAEATKAAVLIVRHVNKGKAADGLSAGGGSIAFTGLARAQLMVDLDPNDPSKQRRVLVVSKCNLAPKPAGLTFKIEGEESGATRLAWGEETTLTADDLVAAQQTAEERSDGNDADRWLREALTDGPQTRAKIHHLARGYGYPGRTVDRAAKRIGVLRASVGFGAEKHATWSLPVATEAIPANPASPASAAIADKPATDLRPISNGRNGLNGGNTHQRSLWPDHLHSRTRDGHWHWRPHKPQLGQLGWM